MRRPYQNFDQRDRRTIRNWYIGLVAVYLTSFVALLATIIVNSSAARWASAAAQADITQPESDSAKLGSELTIKMSTNKQQ